MANDSCLCCFVAVSLLSYLSQLVWPSLFTPIFYWGGRLCDDPLVFLATCVVVALNIAVFTGLGTLVVALFPARALTALLTTMTFIFAFSGMFKPLSETPFPFLGYANPVCYTTGVVMRLIFREADTYEPAEPGGPPLTRADVLARYPVALPLVPSGVDVLVLVLLGIVTRLAACLVLARRMRRLLLTQQQAEPAAAPPTKATSSSHARVAPAKGLLGADSAAMRAAELQEPADDAGGTDRV